MRVHLVPAGLVATVSGGILTAGLECGPAPTRAALFTLLATMLRRAEFSRALSLPDARTTPLFQEAATQVTEMFTAAVERACVRFKGQVVHLRETRGGTLDAPSTWKTTELMDGEGLVLCSVHLRLGANGVVSTETVIAVR